MRVSNVSCWTEVFGVCACRTFTVHLIMASTSKGAKSSKTAEERREIEADRREKDNEKPLRKYVKLDDAKKIVSTGDAFLSHYDLF